MNAGLETETSPDSCKKSSSNTLVVPPWNITASKRTFHYRATSLWNRLPVDVPSKYTEISLPKFRFSVKFPILLHVILKLQIKKMKT